MDIRRNINRNGKLIWYILMTIIFIFFGIKMLNTYYENNEEIKQKQLQENIAKEKVDILEQITEDDYETESYSVEVTLASFVNYCNTRDLEKAYKMLTDECKNAMFPTIQDFERIYINNIYKTERTIEMIKWSTEGNYQTYLVTLYGDLLATGGKANTTQEYCTFVEQTDGTYKLNINNYIYGEERNLTSTINGVTINIGNVDIYEEYERVQITITNNTSKTICLTGNKYGKNIYLENVNEIKYVSINSKFDNQEIIMNPEGKLTMFVDFNKVYGVSNKAKYLVLSDIILDYEEYLTCEEKDTYSNRTSIKVQY